MESTKLIFSKRDLKDLDKTFNINFINSLCGYRSINLCGTIDGGGRTNLAIFNSILLVDEQPPLIGMLVYQPKKAPAHTLKNIREKKFFTLNHVHQDFFNRAHQTAAHYNETKSEFEVVGLTEWFGKIHPAPYVHESPIKIGLELRNEYEIKSNKSILVIGEIIETIVPLNAVLSDGLIDLGITGTITGSGLDTYYTTQKIARLSIADPNKDLDIIG